MSRPENLKSIDELRSIGQSDDVWRNRENIDGFIEKLKELRNLTVTDEETLKPMKFYKSLDFGRVFAGILIEVIEQNRLDILQAIEKKIAN